MTEKTYETPCGSIHYWVNGKRSAPFTLVFLPGLTADHRLFVRQMSYFSDTHHVFVWDAPGHHHSRPFDLTFSLMDKARWLREILQREGIARPVLIGQSMGGYVAQCYLETYPDKAVGFISIDSAPLKRKYVTAVEIWALKHCEGMYRLYPWKTLLRDGPKGCAVTAYGRQLMGQMMESYSKDEYCRLAGHGYRILAEAMEADLPYRIPCPVLLICGEKDRAGSTKRYNKAWSRGENIPIRWIPNAGHNSNTDAPEEVNAMIENFLLSEETTVTYQLCCCSGATFCPACCWQILRSPR